eukprot:CAMPEP_0113667594 /NCGR_PEP_ID=MMETSP0038_2-20120614/3525_1 /TAXON_ID=2898 /ORGANISM="Cryptomonas paramecium" /LENGTH=180 /DNA_ID=CAMNT_0000583231 /DNA_START=33 /DNA_END=572 /DNA_ORIENTATION=- /assembly_acc=CAM_ASM_000170
MKGKVEAILYLETSSMDSFLRELLESLRELEQDFAQTKKENEDIRKQLASMTGAALGEQIAALKLENSKLSESFKESTAQALKDKTTVMDGLAALKSQVERSLAVQLKDHISQTNENLASLQGSVKLLTQQISQANADILSLRQPFNKDASKGPADGGASRKELDSTRAALDDLRLRLDK